MQVKVLASILLVILYTEDIAVLIDKVNMLSYMTV